jgi:hypothetical protein
VQRVPEVVQRVPLSVRPVPNGVRKLHKRPFLRQGQRQGGLFAPASSSIPPVLAFEPRETSFELFERHRPDLSSARRIERDREQLTDVLNVAPKTVHESLGVPLGEPVLVAARLTLPLGEGDGAARVLLGDLRPVVGIPLRGREARRARLLERGAKGLLRQLGRDVPARSLPITVPAESSMQEPHGGQSRILELVKGHLRVTAVFIEHATRERHNLRQLARSFHNEDVGQLRRIRIELVTFEPPELGMHALSSGAGLDFLESGFTQQAVQGAVVVQESMSPAIK